MKAKLLLAASGIVFSLLALEVFVRFAEPPGAEWPPDWVVHETIGWVRPPHQGGFSYQRNFLDPELFKTRWQTNSRGYRDREYPLEKSGKLRILVLGDSMTEGWGVEQDEAYPKRLEDRYLQGVEVWNLGVAGYSTDMELEQLRSVIDSYKPDLVIVGFYENDLADNCRSDTLALPARKPLYALQGDALVLTNRDELVRQKVAADRVSRSVTQNIKKLAKYSALVRLMTYVVRRSLYVRATDNRPELRRDVWKRHNPYRASETDEVRAAWRLAERLLIELNRLGAQHNAKLVVTYLPRALEMVPGVLDAEQKNLSVQEPSSQFDFDKPQRTLADICLRNRIPFASQSEAFRASPHPEGLYLPNIPMDGHMSAQGHDLIARTLAGFLSAQGLVPPQNALTGQAPASEAP